ncbi:hypothetical protein [Galbibacter mesophilus]|uniref:hypothetical protein n=1 Tax=Galbibacter mesophilus TaxID=379069 RepID=UPI00191EAC77|nr:hypothetical protein [Galbibacter mesophilus]MCM5664178.1 hypothetical protein [Galbibacter mesophilus]
MQIFNTIKNFLIKKSNNQEIKAPEGFCPNCWGRQEYGGDFFEAMKKEGINVTNIDHKKGWILDYVEKNLSGIILQTVGKTQVCNVCYTTYPHDHN